MCYVGEFCSIWSWTYIRVRDLMYSPYKGTFEKLYVAHLDNFIYLWRLISVPAVEKIFLLPFTRGIPYGYISSNLQPQWIN